MRKSTMAVVVGIAIPPVLLVVLATLHTWSSEAEARQIGQRVQTLRSEIADLQQCSIECDQLVRTQLPAVKNLVPILKRTVGRVSSPPRFLPLFDRLAEESGITIRTCRWARDPARGTPSPRYRTVSFFITVRGSEQGILSFIGALESNPRPIALAGVDMNRKGRPDLPLEANIQAQVVVRNRSSRG